MLKARDRLKRLPHELARRFRLRRLKNACKGKRCFILGNGRSLKDQNLSLLREEYVFGVNWFVLHPEFRNLERFFYFCGDPRFWRNGLIPELSDRLLKHEPAKCFFSAGSERMLRLTADKRLLKNACFLRLDQERKVWDGYFSSNIPAQVHWGLTTIIDLCLPVAFYMGFDPVYLMGCDCDYNLEQKPDFSASYFYDIAELPRLDHQYLIAQTVEPDQFNRTGRLTASYEVVRGYFERNNRRIYNAGAGGKLEAFPRVAYESLFDVPR